MTWNCAWIGPLARLSLYSVDVVDKDQDSWSRIWVSTLFPGWKWKLEEKMFYSDVLNVWITSVHVCMLIAKSSFRYGKIWDSVYVFTTFLNGLHIFRGTILFWKRETEETLQIPPTCVCLAQNNKKDKEIFSSQVKVLES